PPKPQIGQGRFMEAVRTAKEAIAEGDAFQVVLSRRDYGRMAGDPLAFYEALRAMNPSPYMYYLDFGVRRVIGASPEMLLRVEDLTATTFPIAGTALSGTVSGAPKSRAMEILHALEGTARGPYAGVVGYLSLNGNMDTAIAIRTLFADGPTYYMQAGAGIVADSDPAREWIETEQKLEGLRAALREAAA